MADNYTIKNSDGVVLSIAADEVSSGVYSPRVTVRGLISNPSATLTLPNSVVTYTTGDLMANSATAGSVTALEFDCGSDSFIITGLTAKSNRTSSTTVGNFRLHLYTAALTVDTVGDDGVYSDNVNLGAARYLGSLDFSIVDRRLKDGHVAEGIPTARGYIPVKLSSGTTIYGYVEARSNYARSQVGGNSETLQITLDILPNS